MVPSSSFRIALVVACISALVAVVAIYFLSNGSGHDDHWRLAVGSALAVFVGSWAITYLVVDRYVKERVDLIHRTMHEARGGRPALGNKNGHDLSAVDIEVSKWAEEKRSEISELRERERFRREFIGNLAHELRTPIFSIQGYILTLLEGGLEDPKVNRSFLQRASIGAERMIRIVEDLDLITQLEGGVLSITPKRMDLRKLVSEIVDDLRIRAAERKVVLRNDAIEEEFWVKGDRDRLAQVLSNLLVNAVRYIDEGGTCPVRAYDIGEQVLVEVADDGPGIAEEHLPRLFERFYRVGKSRARNEGGSGLGLSIVKHIVEGHGGTISAKSTEGKGTTFNFTLPKAG